MRPKAKPYRLHKSHAPVNVVRFLNTPNGRTSFSINLKRFRYMFPKRLIFFDFHNCSWNTPYTRWSWIFQLIFSEIYTNFYLFQFNLLFSFKWTRKHCSIISVYFNKNIPFNFIEINDNNKIEWKNFVYKFSRHMSSLISPDPLIKFS